jgi:radical SAM superfamily enzyme YgiQ (UPF0313 family)
VRAVLISTYDMGRQPFGLASPAAWLRADGWDVTAVDAAKQKIDAAMLSSADLIAFHLPMHTATRLAAPVIAKARHLNPSARMCAYGLYAPLNAKWLRSIGVDAIFGGEFEEELTAWAGATREAGLKACATPEAALKGCATAAPSERPASLQTLASSETPASSQTLVSVTDVAQPFRAAKRGGLPRIHFLVPDRTGLPPLSRYATLQLPDGTRRLVGYTEASRGCKHLCRHCPIVPVYEGQFRVVQPDVVLADIDAQVAAGAQHITFGDPDFFNGPAHAMRIVDALHAAHASVSYDAIIKVEHLLAHRDLLPRLTATGCAFVTSAVESVDDRVLALLDKGHTRADFIETVAACRDAGVTLIPTFVAFQPWLTLESYCDLLDTVADLDLVGHVAPIQLAIRLLIPEGSRLLALDEMRRHVGAFDPATLTHRWTHPDPRVDALHTEIAALVGARLTADRWTTFDAISALAHRHAGLPRPSSKPARNRATVPFLDEPWYC